MKLARARVTNFKSVLDSEWFSVRDLTCLVEKRKPQASSKVMTWGV